MRAGGGRRRPERQVEPRRGRTSPAPRRLFDVAVEEPDLGRAERRGRAGRPIRRSPEGRGTARPPAEAVNPRIAARRVEVEADQAAVASRRRRSLAVATVALAAVLGAAAFALLGPVAGVRTVEVVGAPRTGAPAVLTAGGLSGRPPLIRVDEAQVAAGIVALPWVGGVKVERRWPRTVIVSVVEREPAAVAPCQAGAAAACLVDAGGRVLAPVGDDPQAADLPRLAGVPAAGEPGATLPEAALGPLAVALALPVALRPLVAGVRGEAGEVSLDLRASGREAAPPVIRLGAPDRIPDKLTAAATVLARTSVNGLAVLDVRVPESPALTRVRR